MMENKTRLSRSLIVGHRRDGRCRYDPEAKRELVEACLQPGVSVAGIALEHGINANLLRKWIDAYRRGLAPATPVSPASLPAFAPVVSSTAPVPVGYTLSVALSNGVKLDLCGVGPDDLSPLLTCLAELPFDGRKAINGLALLVEQGLGLNPFEPAIFVFSNRPRDRIKLLLWDRTGFWLMLKRLEADRFRWPKDAAVVELTVEQLHWLLAGIDLAAMRPHPQRNYTKVG
jgi:transposase